MEWNDGEATKWGPYLLTDMNICPFLQQCHLKFYNQNSFFLKIGAIFLKILHHTLCIGDCLHGRYTVGRTLA